MANNPHVPSETPWFDLRAFLPAVLAPLLLWATLVVAATLSGYPGVACSSPMSWLLAFWAGRHYTLRTGGRPARRPLLAPTLVGAALGIGIGALFVYGSHVMMASEVRPDEIARARTLTVAMFVSSLVVCSVLGMVGGWSTQRRLARRR